MSIIRSVGQPGIMIQMIFEYFDFQAENTGGLALNDLPVVWWNYRVHDIFHNIFQLDTGVSMYLHSKLITYIHEINTYEIVIDNDTE